MSEISKIYDALNDIPVDRLAASMFWKTPWWADVPGSVATVIAHEVIRERLPAETVIVDYFKAPPRVNYNKKAVMKNVEDRRGWEVEIPEKGIGIIVGYAYAKEKFVKRTGSSLSSPPWWWKGEGWGQGQSADKRTKRLKHVWWMYMNGEFSTIKQETIAKYRRENI